MSIVSFSSLILRIPIRTENHVNKECFFFRNLGGSEFPPKFFEIWAAGQERKGHTFEKLACFVSRGGSMDPDSVPVKTRPRAAMMICSRRETKLRHRLRTAVRVRFTTAEKLNLDPP